MTRPIPEGYHRLGAYLAVDGAAAAIDWYARVFGATERMRLPAGEKIGHAELAFGDSVLMLSDAWPEAGGAQPPTGDHTTVGLHLYVEDVDTVFAAAVAAGAVAIRPVRDEFYGDRIGMIRDPFGHVWSLATHIEDVAPEEIVRRAQAMFGS